MIHLIQSSYERRLKESGKKLSFVSEKINNITSKQASERGQLGIKGENIVHLPFTSHELLRKFSFALARKIKFALKLLHSRDDDDGREQHLMIMFYTRTPLSFRCYLITEKPQFNVNILVCWKRVDRSLMEAHSESTNVTYVERAWNNMLLLHVRGAVIVIYDFPRKLELNSVQLRKSVGGELK
jgi:hypothetical protein